MSSSKPHLVVTRAYEPGDTAAEQPAVAPGKQIGPFTTWRTMWQPRPLTIPALLVTFSCLLIINSAGYPTRIFSPDIEFNNFGWPFRYLRAPLTERQQADCPPWDRVTDIPLPAPRELPVDFVIHKDFRATALWQNVLVAMLISVCVAIYADVAQRVIFKQSRFGLRQLFGAIVVIAVVLVASRSSRVFEFYCEHRAIRIFQTIALYVGAIGACCIVVAHVFVVAARNWQSDVSLHSTASESDISKIRTRVQ